jgi:transcription elongation factor GreB
MSKAFTRESDDAPELQLAPRAFEALPPGTKNYITPDGAERLRAELNRLIEVERPRAAALVENARSPGELQAIDQRIIYLDQSLKSAMIVPPPAAGEERVRFGANVRVRNREKIESQYRIVGIDETDLDRGWVSWRSPIAKALMNGRVGQRVGVRLPDGEDELEIVEVSYR